MELVTVVTLLGVAFFFIYFAFKLPKSNKPIRIFFTFLALLMIYLAIGALYTGGLAPENRLNSTLTTCYNVSGNVCANQTTNYTYANYTKAWAYGPASGALSLIQYAIMFIMFYFLIFFLIGILEFLVDVVIPKKKGDQY